MCGIAGLIPKGDHSFPQDLVPTLFRKLEHRGPDDQGYLVFAQNKVQLGRNWKHEGPVTDLVLLHKRLSILELTEAGWQPMGLPDGRYYIVFNGEIYNYLELRQQLQTLGHRFHTRSDTEVLLAAYAQWGLSSLPRLVGMFAFAILNVEERKLLLARDFFGIKPLYYSFAHSGFVFASEINALIEIPGISRTVNPERVYLYLRYGLTDHGSETLFADIHQIPPAHYLVVPLDDPMQARLVRYWEVNLGERSELSFDAAAERLRDLFFENIRLHLRSDVPVGAALSGGIDSSAIVLAMRHIQGKDLDLHTFSYIADDPSICEDAWVDLANQASAAVQHKVRPKAEEILSDLEHLTGIQGEAFGSTSIYAQYRVFRLAREVGIKVMLDGQGADEILGGYAPYVAARLASLLRQGQWVEARRFFVRASRLPGLGKSWLLTRIADFLMPPKLQAYMRPWIGKDLEPPWLNAAWFRERGAVPKVLNYTRGKEVLKENLYRTLSETSLPHLLRYEDRNGMAFSIESRVPFLTPALVSFMFSLPEQYFIDRDGTTKAIFRRAMRGIVPEAILNRRDKIGFATPERNWLTTMHPWAVRTFRSEPAARIPALNLKEIEWEWEAVLHGRKPFDFRLWRWINLIEWARKFNASFG